MPFRAITGHRRLVALLSRAIAQGTLPPSLLVAGPEGIGKRRLAMAVAETLNCLSPVESPDLPADACGACAQCTRIARGVHPEILIVEPDDKGSIKTDVVRGINERVAYRPFEGRRRVVVIDKADALEPQAQNALLKTLEEPPSATVFLLLTSAPDALLATVRSRCPPLRAGRLTATEVAEILVRETGMDEREARAVAASADGSVGLALEAAAGDVAAARTVAVRVLHQAARSADPRARIDLAKTLSGKTGTGVSEREQATVYLRALASLLRDVSVMSTRADAGVLANVDLGPGLEDLARSFDSERSVRAFTAVDRALGALERNASPKIVADWLMLQL